MEVVINECFGGFSLSRKAEREYLKLKGKEAYFYEQIYDLEKSIILDKYKRVDDDSKDVFMTHTITKDLGETTSKLPNNKSYFYMRDIERNDPDLVKVIKKFGNEANGAHAELKIVEIPDNANWEIDEYDGSEHIAEQHRTWS